MLDIRYFSGLSFITEKLPVLRKTKSFLAKKLGFNMLQLFRRQANEDPLGVIMCKVKQILRVAKTDGSLVLLSPASREDISWPTNSDGHDSNTPALVPSVRLIHAYPCLLNSPCQASFHLCPKYLH